MKLDIGCGMRKHRGYIGIDRIAYKGVDRILDVGVQPLPFADNSVEEILADNIYEHLNSEQLIFSIEECFRVLKPDGFLYVKVPIFGTKAWLIHPDHKMHWTADMFGFFTVPDNEGTVDPHGYLQGFWHLEFIDDPDKPGEALWVKMYPNKPGSPKGYKKVTRYDQTL